MSDANLISALIAVAVNIVGWAFGLGLLWARVSQLCKAEAKNADNYERMEEENKRDREMTRDMYENLLVKITEINGKFDNMKDNLDRLDKKLNFGTDNRV